MIIDMKYHIASLAAVFIALGIGILIGTTIIGSDTLMKKQEALITSLQTQYTALRDENRRTAEELAAIKQNSAYQQEFDRAVLPVLVREKLQGRKVAIVDINNRKEHDNLANVLREAGAEVQSITVINLNQLKDPVVRGQVATFLGKSNDITLNSLLPEFARFFAGALVTGAGEDLVRLLDDKKVLKVSGSYGLPVQDIIMISGGNSKEQDYAKIFDLVLVKAWQTDGIRIFGVEDSDVPVSYMRYYQAARLTTVDNIDSIYGQVALIQAMAGYPGHYGIKPTAEDFLPPL
ncbi:MAG TPA: copper transporter [Syntrophomonadaceae bacterium]|nr:copper transporter [Syntrophomonadaceae bacterium]